MPLLSPLRFICHCCLLSVIRSHTAFVVRRKVYAVPVHRAIHSSRIRRLVARLLPWYSRYLLQHLVEYGGTAWDRTSATEGTPVTFQINDLQSLVELRARGAWVRILLAVGDFAMSTEDAVGVHQARRSCRGR